MPALNEAAEICVVQRSIHSFIITEVVRNRERINIQRLLHAFIANLAVNPTKY